MTQPNMSIHHVMCPTDFSEFARSAFEESVRVARWFGAKVTVLHVVPRGIPTAGELAYVPPPVAISEALRRAKLLELERFVAGSNPVGVTVETMVRDGDPCREIQRAVRESAADLLVMGTHGRLGLGRFILGSVTEAVLRHAPAPVLTVNRAFEKRKGLFRRVLCAADVSEWSAGTIGFAIAIAEDGAEHLTVLNVIEDLPEMRARAEGHIGIREVEAFRQGLEREVIAELQKRIPDEARVSCRIEEHVTFGKAQQEILRVAEEEDADVIVVGSHGRGMLNRLVFGSTVQQVVRGAHCPVLVVPSGHEWPATALVRQTPVDTAEMLHHAEGG